MHKHPGRTAQLLPLNLWRVLPVVGLCTAALLGCGDDESGATSNSSTTSSTGGGATTSSSGGAGQGGSPQGGAGTGAMSQGGAGQGGDAAGGMGGMAPGPFEVLVFHRTEGFAHGSIAPGITAIEQLGAANNFMVTATSDTTAFTASGLAPYRVVVFLNTTGDVLDAPEEQAFEAFIQAGNGYVGVHSATDTEYNWAWYGQLVGAYFSNHPSQQDATIQVVDSNHLSTAHLPSSWMRFDEWYNFQADPSADVTVLLNLDESTYNGGDMGNSHPIAWYHPFDGGRAFYTALGHTNQSYTEPNFTQHLLGGIFYAAGASSLP